MSDMIHYLLHLSLSSSGKKFSPAVGDARNIENLRVNCEMSILHLEKFLIRGFPHSIEAAEQNNEKCFTNTRSLNFSAQSKSGENQ